MSAVVLVALGTLAVFLVMTALWLLGIRNRNFSYVDIGWSANFTLLAVMYATLAGGWPTRKWVIAAMFSLWSVRLAGHLAKRIVGEPEETEPDRRSILLPANRCREALRIRGPFALETAEGAIAFREGDGPPPTALPLFAYDPDAACFRGPPGGPRDRWEVIAVRSPRFQPSAH